uniref:HYLS1 centriolar and ciliogenesis associated n=1 Tax=Oryzias melastigma TaxID=30732 RepID=A0A3B3BV89_ORYME
MDHLDFSEKEIRQQLAVLGYRNIPKHKLLEFKKGLEEVIHGGSWKSPTSTAQMNHSEKTQSSPPAFTKEKVSKEFFRSSEGFFLHEGRAEHNKQLLSTHTIGGSGSQQDSYAQNSVAPKLHFPTGGPTRLQVEPDEDVKDSSDSDSWCSDSRQRRFLKRKVLSTPKEEEDCDAQHLVTNEDEAGIPRPTTSPAAAEPLHPRPKRSKDSAALDPVDGALLKFIQAKFKTVAEEEKDPEVVFGKMVATSLAALSRRNRGLAKLKIQHVLYEMEQKDLESELPTTNSPSMHQAEPEMSTSWDTTQEVKPFHQC